MAQNNQIALYRQGNNAIIRHPSSKDAFLTPAVDVFETADSFVLRLDMPGARKDAIQVSVEPMIVTVRADVKSGHAENASLLVNEIVSKCYYRTFNLTDGIDHANIGAEFSDGVLTVALPKTQAMKKKEIQIK